MDNTIPVLSLYNTFGKVHNIDATGSINNILTATRDALRPNLTLVYGPPVNV
jgi:hypothetical protein